MDDGDDNDDDEVFSDKPADILCTLKEKENLISKNKCSWHVK